MLSLKPSLSPVSCRFTDPALYRCCAVEMFSRKQVHCIVWRKKKKHKVHRVLESHAVSWSTLSFLRVNTRTHTLSIHTTTTYHLAVSKSAREETENVSADLLTVHLSLQSSTTLKWTLVWTLVWTLKCQIFCVWVCKLCAMISVWHITLLLFRCDLLVFNNNNNNRKVFSNQ